MTNMTSRSKIEPVRPGTPNPKPKLKDDTRRPTNPSNSDKKVPAGSAPPSSSSRDDAQPGGRKGTTGGPDAGQQASSHAQSLTASLTPSQALSVWHSRAQAKAQSRTQLQPQTEAQARDLFLASYFSSTDTVVTRAGDSYYHIDLTRKKHRPSSASTVSLVGPYQWRHLTRMLLTTELAFRKWSPGGDTVRRKRFLVSRRAVEMFYKKSGWTSLVKINQLPCDCITTPYRIIYV